MKTAVSLPDRLYEEAEKTAQAIGIPRSQLFAKALEEFEDISNAGLESLRKLTRNDTW